MREAGVLGRRSLAGEPTSGLHILETHYVAREVQSLLNPSTTTTTTTTMDFGSQPTQEGSRGGGGGVDGSGNRAEGLEGLIKMVVIHSVLQWFMSVVGHAWLMGCRRALNWE